MLCVHHFRTTSLFRASYRMLALIYLDISLWVLVNILFYYVRYSPVESLRPYMLPVDLVLLYCLNPLLYFFYRKLHGRGGKCGWRRVMPHFIAPTLALLLVLYYPLQPAPLHELVVATDNFDHSALAVVLHGGFALQSLAYVLYIHCCITRHKANNYLVCRGNLMISLRGFRVLLFAGLAVVVLHGCYYLSGPSSEQHQLVRLLAVNGVGCLLIGVSITDTGSRLSRVANSSFHILAGSKAALQQRREVVGEAERERLMQALLQLMETEKPYLQHDCNLQLLTTTLKSNKSIVSYVLNHGDRKGYSHFINEYRLQHALSLIDQGFHRLHTMDTIARMSGFDNRVTFSRVCKEHRGFCPDYYCRKVGIRD